MHGAEWAKVLLRQFEQSHCRAQPPAMLGMRGVLEIFSKMNERARSLNQTLEEIIVIGVGVEPEMLQHVMRFVVLLIVPTPKIRAIERMLRDSTRKARVVALEIAHELRNSFAFAHEGFNFIMPQMMGKPTFLEGPDNIRRRRQE
jgi:hypothetical protein